MIKYSSKESEYLIKLLVGALKGETVPKPCDDIDWEALVALSKKQQVYSIINPVLGNLPLPDAQREELSRYNQNELLRLIAMKNELEEIEKELEKNGIKFMLLKGSVLRDYYPQQKMRQMSDIDILYDDKKRNILLDIMQSRNYRLTSWSENSDDFFKKPFYTFEFHRELFFDEHTFFYDFSYVWDNAVQDKENPSKYHMCIEDLYLHTVAHMHKHYILGGFGIRFFADIYVLIDKCGDNFNKKYIREKLESMKLTDFEKQVRELTFTMFSENEFSNSEIEFLNNVTSFGIYGNSNQGIKVYYDEYVEKHGKSSVFKYYLSKVFPNRKFMEKIYPSVAKKPIFLPFYYIKRIFNKMIYNRKKIINDIKTLRNSQK